MSNLHLRRNKRVGFSLWVGFLPTVQRQCMSNNAKYFDEFYLLTDRARSEGLDRVIVKEVPDLIEKIFDLITEDYLSDLLIGSHTPARASDILTYMPTRSLRELIGVECDSVMYVDSDYYIYSDFILKEIFTLDHHLAFIRDTNYYLRHSEEAYVNSCLSYQCRSSNYFDQRVQRVLFDYLRTNFSKSGLTYGATGPGFTNSKIAREVSTVLNLEPHTLDPRYLLVGMNTVDINRGSLGIHLAVTLPREVNMTVESIKRIDNKLVIDSYELNQ